MCFGPSKSEKVAAVDQRELADDANREEAEERAVDKREDIDGSYLKKINTRWKAWRIWPSVTIYLWRRWLPWSVWLMDKIAKQYTKKYSKAKAFRENWVPLFEECYEYALPQRESFLC